MPDSAYHNAMRKREALTAEIERVQAELTKIEQWLGIWHELSSEGDAVDPLGPTQGASATARSGEVQVHAPEARRRREAMTRRAPRRGPAREEIARVAREILLSSGRPMPRRELLHALDERGLRVGGADTAGRIRNVGTVMWRLRDRFVNVEGRGYWPADVPHDNPFAPKRDSIHGDEHDESRPAATNSGSVSDPHDTASEHVEGGDV